MDALVLDGGGFVVQNGAILFEAPRFKEQVSLRVVDLDRTSRARGENTTWRLDCEAFSQSKSPAPTLIRCDNGPSVSGHALTYPTPATKNFFLPSAKTPENPRTLFLEDLCEAMMLGFGGYFEKTKAFRSVLIALSGGRDSVLTLLILYRYAQRRFAALTGDERSSALLNFIRCVSMPSRYNSATTKSISRDICRDLGVNVRGTLN